MRNGGIVPPSSQTSPLINLPHIGDAMHKTFAEQATRSDNPRWKHANRKLSPLVALGAAPGLLRTRRWEGTLDCSWPFILPLVYTFEL